MRTYCIAQETVLKPCGDLNGKESPPKKGNICIHIADSFFCTAETNTIL